MSKGLTYKKSGVDIDAGNLFVELIKPLAKSTHNKLVLGSLGGFSGAVKLPHSKGDDLLLVAATDGVGTKLRVAFQTGVFDSIGIDLVAMSVNDIVTTGAKPILFLDYLATSRLDPHKASEIIKGVAQGCKQAGCALLGGETAEMPGFYKRGEFDLAGFAVGVVEKSGVIDGSGVRPGDVLVGLASSGLHSNGYSLARKVLLDKKKYGLSRKQGSLGRKLGEELLEPTRIYVKTILKLIDKFEIKSIAHITGGGMPENIPRVIPKSCKALIKSGSWDVHPIFELIEHDGKVSRPEMMRTFNMGIGMVLMTNSDHAESVVKSINRTKKHKAYIIGEITKKKKGEDSVVFE